MSRQWRSASWWAAGFIVAAVAFDPLGIAVAQDTLTRIRAEGSIRVGFSNENPFSYATPEGELTGIDIEVLQHIMEKMGVKNLDGGLTAFGGLIPGLKARRFDIVASGIYIKPDRCAQVAFAEPMYILGDGILIPKGNPRSIHSYRDVARDPSFKLSYGVGGTGVTDNAKAMGITEAQLVGAPDDATAYALLRSGRVDGYAATGIYLETLLRTQNDPAIERASPFEQPVENGKRRFGIASFAVRLEDKDLLKEMNELLLEFRATSEYTKLMNKYGLTPDDGVQQGMTTATACAG